MGYCGVGIMMASELLARSPCMTMPIAADAPAHRPKRPRMGDKFAAPQLDEFAKLLSLLARSCERAEPLLAEP